MNSTITIYGNISESGDLEIESDWIPYIQKLKAGRVTITISHIGNGKDAMYAYYHAVVLQVGMAMLRKTGEQADEDYTDFVFKSMFAKKKVKNPFTGEYETVLLGKKDMSYARLTQFLNDVILFLESCGYEVPQPKESIRTKIDKYRHS